MAAIHAIFVRGHETRSEPKPHTVYRIQIQGPVRSWQVWRRYSEFDDLHRELSSSTGLLPPAPLPPKHTFSLTRTFNDEKIIQERLVGLEEYLRAIIGSRDARWRDSLAFRDFLSIPSTSNSSYARDSSSHFTSSSWLDEHTDLQSLVRDIRADINKQNALSDTGDVTGSHQSNVQAKKKLATLLGRIGMLATGLGDLAMTGLSEGEVQRRSDMVSRLQDDCEKLGKMVVASRQTNRPFTSNSSADRNPANPRDRAALLGNNPGSLKSGGLVRPTRVFGAAALETDETRPLDDVGVLQLQQHKMDDQDSQLGQLSMVLRRQKEIGLAIDAEIGEQNALLDRLTADVDRVGGKLSGAKKQLNRLG